MPRSRSLLLEIISREEDNVIDARGLVLLPMVIDAQIRLRKPKSEPKALHTALNNKL